MIVKIDNRAFKDLSKLDRVISLELLEKIDSLKSYPNVSNIKRLVNFKPRYRYRVGDYRILFDIENDLLKVCRVLHRKEAY